MSSKLDLDRWDYLCAAGVVSLTIGLGMVYLPLSFIVPGAAAIGASWLATSK